MSIFPARIRYLLLRPAALILHIGRRTITATVPRAVRGGPWSDVGQPLDCAEWGACSYGALHQYYPIPIQIVKELNIDQPNNRRLEFALIGRLHRFSSSPRIHCRPRSAPFT